MRTPRKNVRVPFRKEEQRAFIMKSLSKFGRNNMATTTRPDLRSLLESETYTNYEIKYNIICWHFLQVDPSD